MALEETTIQVSDLDDVITVLSACLTYFQARDLQSAQIAFTAPRPSPLSQEVERVATRYRAYLGDFLLHQHEELLAQDAEDDPEDQEDVEEAEEGAQEVTEASETEDGELSATPLGDFKKPQQKGRRLKADEV